MHSNNSGDHGFACIKAFSNLSIEVKFLSMFLTERLCIVGLFTLNAESDADDLRC